MGVPPAQPVPSASSSSGVWPSLGLELVSMAAGGAPGLGRKCLPQSPGNGWEGAAPQGCPGALQCPLTPRGESSRAEGPQTRALQGQLESGLEAGAASPTLQPCSLGLPVPPAPPCPAVSGSLMPAQIYPFPCFPEESRSATGRAITLHACLQPCSVPGAPVEGLLQAESWFSPVGPRLFLAAALPPSCSVWGCCQPRD